MDGPYDLKWLRATLKASFVDPESDPGFVTDAAGHGGGGGPPLSPAQRAYLLRLITAIREGRALATSYNKVLLAVLVLLTIRHWAGRYNKARRRTKRQAKAKEAAEHDPSPSSSSSSTLEGTSTPPDAAKVLDIDVELVPLLEPSGKPAVRRRSIPGTIRSWLAYQPPPIPIINRHLPSNSTSLLVLAFYGLNAFYQLYHMPLQPEYSFAFADRAALIFIVNLPLLYLLAAKNQPLRLLTGRSYESLNILHRRVGELLCFAAFVHFAGMMLYQLVLCPEWFRKRTLLQFLGEPLVLLGLGAFASYELLYFTSLGSFRQRWYELFLASHVVLQVAALAFLWLHYHTSRPFVTASLAIFLVDRIVWRWCANTAIVQARLTVLPDGDTLMLSANWDIPSTTSWWSRLRPKSVTHGWRPTDHVFLSVPALGRSHALQAHPFTIASAAPAGDDTHAWFNLLIRSHSGFTQDLLHHAMRHNSVGARVEGPYGSSQALDTLHAADEVILVAGGSGIAVVFPAAWALLMDRAASAASATPAKRVHLLWIMHSDEHRHWVPSHLLDDLVAAGLDLVIPPATAVAGRPDVDAVVGDWLDDAGRNAREVAVMVSGPDGLNRQVRNTAARRKAGGVRVNIEVEKFGW
ncbi:hypothetical protein B0T11DRAFT_282427 [Plectosphaerella cucumerina]|uniref:FAD-binding FR-type domain-containing protein n=1 Tax=Plectosphaerella cucumerina TaxID=40658 RepID=A0A8K0X429_9PEZI|nr:hypothetical protein B0T11DRAFT_282427 [Plectosphaerella cucumerina]